MKIKDVKNICRPLLPLLPGFVQQGFMLYNIPSDGLLKGIYFDGSGFDKNAFYVEVFFLPLYVPTTYVHFNFGKRLVAGTKSWNMTADNLTAELTAAIHDEALPFLGQAETAERFADAITEISKAPRNPHVLQAKAYSFAKLGNYEMAINTLNELIDVLDSNEDAKFAWVRELRDNVERFLAQIRNNPASAQQQLDEWEAISRKNLRLSDN